MIPELRVAMEYDSTGRHGLEHIGNREAADRRKDRAVRAGRDGRAGRWEFVRVRKGKLPVLGPYDLQASGVNCRTFAATVEQLRATWRPAHQLPLAPQAIPHSRDVRRTSFHQRGGE